MIIKNKITAICLIVQLKYISLGIDKYSNFVVVAYIY